MRLASSDPTAEVEPPARLLILLPVFEVLVYLHAGSRGVARYDSKVSQGVTPHTLGQPAAFPQSRHPSIAAHALPLALLVLSLTLGRAGVVVPLAGLPILALQGGRELEELGFELAAAVWTDLVVESEGVVGVPHSTRRRATHNL